jgi:hypothetical protein
MIARDTALQAHDAPSRLRRHLRALRNGVLPILSLAAAAFDLLYLRPNAGMLVPLSGTWFGLARLGLFGLFVSLPLLLLAASGLPLRGRIRGALAACMAAYAFAMVRPVTTLAFALTDPVLLPSHSYDQDATLRSSLLWVRAHPDPEAEARRALRWGDDRYFGVTGLGLYPVGVRWPVEAWGKYGMKEMPGFSDVGPSDSRAAREVICWVFRYDTVMAHRRPAPGVKPGDELDPVAMTRWVHHDCDPRPAAGV